MPASVSSPNTGNYFIGKGNVYFTREGGTRRHVGNVPAFSFTPEVETLEHYSSMQGVRTKDFEIITTLEGNIAFTLEEYTPDNLAIAMLATVDYDAVGGPTLDIFQSVEVRGVLEIEGSNQYGAKLNGIFYNVQITPSAEVGFITDELGQIEVEGSVQPATSGPNAGKFGTITFTNVDAPAPSDITSVTPNTGPAAGGTAITIAGTGFAGATAGTLGGNALTSFVVVSDTEITAVTPAHAAGAVALTITDPEGDDTLVSAFTYA